MATPEEQETESRRRGFWLRMARERADLSQATAAAAVGLSGQSKSTLSAWEAGTRPIPSSKLAALIRLYQVDPAAIMNPSPTAYELIDRKVLGSFDFVVTRDGDVVLAGEAKTAPARPVSDKDAARRRSYWLRRARERLRMTREEVDRRLEQRAGTYGRWEDGRTALQGAARRRVAELFRIPEAVIATPPETDEERLEEWQVIPVAEVVPPPQATEPERRRRSA